MIKKIRIPFTELDNEIYTSAYWTKTKLFGLGFLCVLVGFLANFSLEERLNNLLATQLSKNAACPIEFDKAKLSYFPPKLSLINPVIKGRCFNNPQNNLKLSELNLGMHFPSFYPVGPRFHIFAKARDSYINAYPVISLFSQNVKIENTLIDGRLFSAFMPNGVSPVLGHISIEGFLEFKSKQINEGAIDILSTNFYVPAQNLMGFELPKIEFKKLEFSANIPEANNMIIEKLNLGSEDAPIKLNLTGKLDINPTRFNSSNLSLNGDFSISENMLSTFAILKLFLPPNNTSGIYQMQLNGPLGNLGAPKFK